MIVADTNLIAYLLIASPFQEKAEKVLETDAEWSAPPLWRSELRNVLALYLRKNVMDLPKAGVVMDDAEKLVGAREKAVPSSRVLALVKESSLSSYDCEFAALAQAEEVPLVTADAKVLKAFPDTAFSFDRFIKTPRESRFSR